MTVWIYTDTNKPEGDVERLKVFATADAAKSGSRHTIRKAWRSNTR
jgi:hypothetical protein